MDLTALQLMERLISFPTDSRESNLALIEFVEDYLTSHGVASTRVPNDDGTKASLYAHIGPEVEGGVVLSGHTDVVPVDGQAWDTDPFTVTLKDDKYFGRGTCDMKGFDALALWAVPLALKADLKRPLQIALSYDEEVGCLGAPPMIDHMLSHGMPKADTVIVGEPSMMQVVTGHKGGFGYDIHVRGFEVHSSLIHTGVSAIMMGAKIIEWANLVNAENAARTPNPIAAEFVPPFTTTHVGTIRGGTANNITAKDCWLNLNFRLVPGEDLAALDAKFKAKIAEVEAEMQAIVPDTGIDLSPSFRIPGLVPEELGRAEALCRQLTGDNGGHVVSYGTEAGQFQDRGYSAAICGPGDIAQAHQPNEFLTVAQFEKGQVFIKDLIKTLSA